MDQEDPSDTEQEEASKNATDHHEENSTTSNEEKDESEEEGEAGKVYVDEKEWQTCSEESEDEDHAEENPESTAAFYNSSRLLHKNELLEIFKSVHSGLTCKDGQITVGLVS